MNKVRGTRIPGSPEAHALTTRQGFFLFQVVCCWGLAQLERPMPGACAGPGAAWVRRGVAGHCHRRPAARHHDAPSGSRRPPWHSEVCHDSGLGALALGSGPSRISGLGPDSRRAGCTPLVAPLPSPIASGPASVSPNGGRPSAVWVQVILINKSAIQKETWLRARSGQVR